MVTRDDGTIEEPIISGLCQVSHGRSGGAAKLDCSAWLEPDDSVVDEVFGGESYSDVCEMISWLSWSAWCLLIRSVKLSPPGNVD